MSTDPTDYGMFSKAGNRAVAEMVAVARTVALKKRPLFLQAAARKIAMEHPEVTDTTVRALLDKALRESDTLG